MGTFYAPNDYRNYIAHYGVKGMKWGVRKQRAPSTDRMQNFKTAVKKKLREVHHDNFDRVTALRRQRIEAVTPIDQEIDRYTRGRASKTRSGKLSEYMGAGATRTAHEARARYNDEMAKTYANAKWRRELQRRARNERSLANAYDKSAKVYEKGGKAAMKRRMRNLVVNPDVLKATYERPRSGKKITYGRHMAEVAANKAIEEGLKYYLNYRRNQRKN